MPAGAKEYGLSSVLNLFCGSICVIMNRMIAGQMGSEVAAKVALTDLPLTSFRPLRYRPRHHGTWSGHLAFAHDLITAIAPSLVVELGTHWGESYFGFCQSIFENGLDCRSFAVDHWLRRSPFRLVWRGCFR